MDPKQIKLKTVNELKDEDKSYIREHPDQFSDEDREAWKDAFPEGAPVAETVEAGDEGGNPEPTPAPSPDPVQPPAGTPAPSSTPASTTPESGITFKNEEEAKEYMRKFFAEEKQKAFDAAKTPEEKKWVEDNWKPKSWNEGIKTAAEAAADIIEQRQVLRNKQIEEHNKKVEADWQTLRKENNLKDLTDPEGQKVHDAIVSIGVKFGKKNFKDAYEVYKMVPKEHGGGWEPTPAKPNPEPQPTPTPEITPSQAASVLAKQKSSAQKAAAAKVGGQNPGTNASGGNSPIKEISYEDLKGKSNAKLLREALHG